MIAPTFYRVEQVLLYLGVTKANGINKEACGCEILAVFKRASKLKRQLLDDPKSHTSFSRIQRARQDLPE
ncbi:MAG: hypothetical protein M1274_12290 [Actinobacteria bacterium]|nr:hypothetical protein [Actinomycetota bacterium]